MIGDVNVDGDVNEHNFIDEKAIFQVKTDCPSKLIIPMLISILNIVKNLLLNILFIVKYSLKSAFKSYALNL